MNIIFKMAEPNPVNGPVDERYRIADEAFKLQRTFERLICEPADELWGKRDQIVDEAFKSALELERAAFKEKAEQLSDDELKALYDEVEYQEIKAAFERADDICKCDDENPCEDENTCQRCEQVNSFLCAVMEVYRSRCDRRKFD
jgi:hypothetical protein